MTFEEIFEELARHNDRSVIWNNWLEYTIKANLIYHKEKDTTRYHGNEEAYTNLINAWLNELTIKLEKYPYYDILGEFYEELIQSKSKKSSLGQVYTPPAVTNLLSEICFNENKKYNDLIANDPACGSARTLLSAHVKSKGDVFVVGNDLDLTSCLMATLNLFTHGARGSILHMDTLEGAFYKGWRVNKYLYHGIPVPHIEEIYSPMDAYDFIELKRHPDNDKKIIVDNATITRDVQSTLI